MKHILRKPLLPLLLVLVLLFGVCFMTLFSKGIADDRQQVENLYLNTKLIFQVLPGENSTTALQLDTHTGGKILDLDAVDISCTRMECLYSLRAPQSIGGIAKAYGTNNPQWLGEDRDISISYGQGWDDQRFLRQDGFPVPCIMESEFCDQLGLQTGDTFIIAGTYEEELDPAKAPDLTMVLAGEFTDVKGKMGKMTLIVPEWIFLAKPGLLFNSNMMYDCFYRSFSFQLESSYNKEYKQVQDQVEEILKNSSKFTVYSNARVQEQSVRPIERRLQIQQMLVVPLGILFCIAAAVLSVLIGLSLRSEIFLRFMWGEKRGLVFWKMLLSIGCVIMIGGICLVPLIICLAGMEWLFWASGYYFMCMLISMVCGCVPLLVTCMQNLVALYQTREGS